MDTRNNQTRSKTEEDGQGQILLSILLPMYILGALILIVFLLRGGFLLYSGVSLLVYSVWAGSVYWLIKRQKIKQATIIFVGVFGALVLISSFFFGGVRNPGNLIFPVLALITALIMNTRSGVFVLLLSVFGIGMLYILEINGLLLEVDAPNRLTSLNYLLVLIASIILTVVPVNLTMRRIKDTRRELERQIIERKKIEDELRKNAARFQQVWEQSTDAMALSDKDGIVVAVNPAYTSLYGFSEEQLVGKTFAVIFPKEMQATAIEQYHVIYQSGEISESYESVVRRADGSERIVESRATFIQDNGIKIAMLSIIRDITHKKRIEQNLQESKKRFSAAFYEMPIPASILDIHSGERVAVNDKFIEVFGFSRDELEGDNFLMNHIAISDEELIAAVNYLRKHRSMLDYPLRMRTKDGDIRDVQVRAALISEVNENLFITSYVDITEWKKAEEIILRSNLILGEIEKMARIGGWELDVETQRVTFTKGTYRIHEIQEGIPIELDEAIDYYVEESRSIVTKAVNEAIKTGKPYDIEVPFQTAKGKEIWIRTQGRAYLEDGNLVRLFGSIQDITERKIYMTKLEKSKNRLQLLHEIDMAILETRSPKKISTSIVAQLRDILSAQRVVISLVDIDKASFEVLAMDTIEPYQNIDPAKTEIQDVIDVASQVKGGEYLILNDFELRDQHVQELRRRGIHQGVFIPMIVNDALIGIITALYTETEKINVEHLAFAEQIASQLAIAIHQAELVEKVLQSQKHLQELAQQLITTQEDERQRIARELHDESGQMLTALNIQLDIISAQLTDEQEILRAQIENANTHLRETMQRLRSLAHGLRPPILDTLGLDTSIHDLCIDFCERVNVRLFFHADILPKLSDIVGITLYRFTQEALTNIAKHAKAREIHVKLTHQQNTVMLTIQDNGIGFDSSTGMTNGMGLENMKQRLELVGGTLDVHSQLGQGTRLVANVPTQD